MGKRQFCRICRTENNLKYSTKELREINKKQLLLANTSEQGQGNNKASKKLLLTTPTLGNICQVCDGRIQIFHRLDDGGHDCSSDVEIEVVESSNNVMPTKLDIPNTELIQRTERPETPVIVDDDDMLFNIFMQKLDHKNQMQRHHIDTSITQHPTDRQFINQFHTPYTPPQSTAGGSEGDETKVIEVLTSRESTPAPIRHTLPPPSLSSSNLVDQQGHRIVAVIEIDDADENESTHNEERPSGLLTPATSSSNDLSFTDHSVDHRSGLISPIKSLITQSANAEEDDEEIVFRKVDIDQDITQTTKKRKRKSYDEKELRLVASLSLVSSDSETEDSPAKSLSKKSLSAAPASIAAVFMCKVCKIKLPDSESLSVHERIHQGVKCILCQVGFQQEKRLIYHMRRKHREYNGVALFEKPRTGQDSCMTIRLRYEHRTTFYECQLCGRIDEIFGEHKEHIIEKHPNESKTLKDPIMKQLKCPVCKAKCGAQYLSLCRHLISTHEYQEYKSFLRELLHVSSFGWNEARQQEVAKTAKIFQFIKRKTFFFECKICRKVVAGYLHHIRHVNKHQTDTKVEITTSNETATHKSFSINSNLELTEFEDNLKIDKLCSSKKLKNVVNKSKNNLAKNKLKKSNQVDKVDEKPKKILKTKVNDIKKSKLKINKTNQIKIPTQAEKSKKTTLSTKRKEAAEEESNKSRKKIQIKINLKAKDEKIKKILSAEKLTKGKPKRALSKNIKKDTEKTKETKKEKVQRSKVKKIKITPPIRQIDLQKFKCKYCLKKIKGFRLFNLHLLQQHKENEYTKCTKCNKLLRNSSNAAEHIKQCTTVLTFRQKRKFNQHLADNTQEYTKQVPNNCNITTNSSVDNYLWLEDLLKLKESSETSDNKTTYLESTNTALFINKQLNLQCCYCLHLFANDKDLKEHTKEQHLVRQEILIKYKPLKAINK